MSTGYWLIIFKQKIRSHEMNKACKEVMRKKKLHSSSRKHLATMLGRIGVFIL